ncbi:MAG: hypothetical protein ABII23_04180 [bacterium]
MKKKKVFLKLTYNWQLKLLAVGTALFLWLYVGFVRNTKTKPPRKAWSNQNLITNDAPKAHEK